MVQGRRCKFRPRIVGDAERDLWQAAENAYGHNSNLKTQLRIVRDFTGFMHMNGLEVIEAFRMWVGCARADGVAWGTIDTYAGYLQRVILVTLPFHQRLDWKGIRSVIRAAHADSDTGSAAMCTDQQLETLLPMLTLAHRRVIAAITFTGCRFGDLRRWRKKQCMFGRRCIKVEVRLSKNRRRRARRRILRLPRIDRVMGWEVDPSLISLQAERLHPDALIFAGTSVGEVNAELRAVCRRLGWSDVLTTYSFRKMFIRKVSIHMKFEWARIITWTLHTGVDVVAAHYDVFADIGHETEDN